MRVVSVLPSATEIVAALGHSAELVGRSSECDFPDEVRRLPVVMRPTTLDADRPSAEIDARVATARAAGESLYTLDVELLRSLRPDVILTQDLCGVCSVTDDEVRAACREAGVEPRVVSLAPRDLDGVWDTVAEVGATVDDPSAGEQLADRLRARARPSPAPAESRHRVAVVEWLDPPILAGLWVPTMVARAGGIPIGPRPGAVGERTSWEALGRAAPDLVVLAPCSFSVGRSQRELEDPVLAARIRGTCGRLGTVVADEAYFSRPGPRLADGLDLLRAALHGSLGPTPMTASYLHASAEAGAL